MVGWGGFHSIMWSPQLRFVLGLGCDNIYISSKLSCTSVERYSTCIMHYAWHMGRTKPLEPEPWDQTLGTHPALGLGTKPWYTTLEANLGTKHWQATLGSKHWVPALCLWTHPLYTILGPWIQPSY